MSQFGYVAVSSAGQRVTGTVRSRSNREAVKKLLEMGYHPISIALAAPTLRERWLARSTRRVKASDLAVFTRQMSALLKAGLPMLHAMSTLRRQCSNQQLATVIQEMEETIAQDAGTFSEAMERYPRIFDPVYRGLVRAGEESGNLAETLKDLADYLGRVAKLRGQVVGAFIYPIFLVLMGLAAIFVLMTFVIPKFQDLFTSFGQGLPWPTQVLIGISGFLSSWWWAVIGGVCIAGLVFISALRRLTFRLAFDKAMLRLPVLGGMLLKIEVSRISRTLSSLLNSGIRILEALRITGDTTRNQAVKGSFDPIIRGVSSGDPLADCLQKSGLFPVLMVNLVKTGEDTGELPQMLSELSAIYEDEAERAVNGAVKLLEPLLIVVMGGAICGIVAAVVLPIFQANAAIG